MEKEEEWNVQIDIQIPEEHKCKGLAKLSFCGKIFKNLSFTANLRNYKNTIISFVSLFKYNLYYFVHAAFKTFMHNQEMPLILVF